MTLSLLLQLTVCSLIACGAIYTVVNKLSVLGLKNQQIPRFWISIIMGFIMALPNVVIAILSIHKIITPAPPPSIIFMFLIINLFFFIPLLTMLRPFNYSLSAARLEIPFLFAICVIYFFYGLEGETFTLKKIIPMGIIFIMFCYDIMRMLELGDYKIESTAKESKTKSLLTVFAMSVIFALSVLPFAIYSDIFSTQKVHTFYEILLLSSAVILGILPNICIIVTWLKNNAPPELLVCSIIFSYVFTCSFLIPLVAFYIPVLCTTALIFCSVISLVGLAVLWLQVTYLTYSNRIVAVIMLAIFLILTYSNF